MPRRIQEKSHPSSQDLSGKRSIDPVDLAVDGPQLESVCAHVEDEEETVLETSKSGVIMLASPPDISDSSGSREQHTAIVVTPVHDYGKNRIRFDCSQPLLETNRRIEPHGGEILRVSLTGSTELRSNRSLEALCNAADSELKNIGHQVASDEQLVEVKDSRYSNQVACVVNSVVGSSSRLVLPAVRLESDSTGNNPSEAVLLMQKPVVVSDNSNRSAGFYLPVTRSAVSSDISISNSSVDCAFPVTLSQTIRMMSNSVVQSSQRDPSSGLKLSRHTCRFCGRVCAKPSVLQKHIRTHTGERPFPCTTCGLRFKTKSNLYKHCKSRTHLYALSGSESLTADESVSSASAKLVAEEDQTDDTAGSTVRTINDDQDERLKNAESVTKLQLSPAFTDNKVSPDAAGTGCKLLTVIDGNMYVMDQVTLPSWQPVIQQLQQGAAMSLNVPLQTTAVSECRNILSEQLSHSSVRVAVVPTTQSEFSATSVDARVVPQIIESSAATVEALQEHITRLISENASIINTPMAEAPRAKRILRQSSDVTASSASKLTAGRPLLRTRSLTPCPTALPASSQNDADSSSSSGAVSSEGSYQKLLLRASSETAAYSSQQVSGLSPAGKQFLTVPKEPHCIEDITTGVTLLPSKDEEDTVGADIQCSEVPVRIVLELADSLTATSSVSLAKVDERSIASHVPVLSTSVTAQPLSVTAMTACKSSMSSQPAECQNRTLLPVTGLVPTFCMIKPVEQATVSRSGLPVQYVQANRVTPSVPLQCVLVGNNDVTVPGSLHSSSVADTQSSSSVIIEVVSAQQQPRRGRPKGSKNRPKLAASASEPRGSVTPRTVPVSEPLSASVVSAPTTDALWRLKLKDQLMRRSLSAERHGSPARQEDKPVLSCCESVSQCQNISTVSSCGSASPAAKGSQLLSTSSLGTTPSVAVTAKPVVRSHSCDASVPPKKRRKTLTELGRGTAFGTRVEESAPAIDLHSDRIVDTNSLSVADDSVFESQSQNSSLAGCMLDNVSSTNLFPLTNRALQIMYNSPPRASALCSSAVIHGTDTIPDSVKSQSLFIRLPAGIGSKIPGLVRRSDLGLESDSAVTVSPTLTAQNTTGSSLCSGDDLKVLHCSAACRDRNTVKVFTHLVSTSDCRSSTCVASAPSVAVIDSGGQKAACSSAASVDETELFELPLDVSASSGTLLLLGHSYPSLGIVAEPTFCSILGTQPTCIETSGEANGHVSMYNTWRASGSSQVASDELVLTAQETFSLYRTSRLGKDMSYAAAPAFDSRSGGVLTHSSYWKYRTDRSGSDGGERSVANATVDAGRAVDVPLTSSEASGCSTEENGMSSDMILSEDCVSSSKQSAASEIAQSELKVVCSRSTEGSTSQRRVWIFPGGYRSTESYVYVRGRGRGRYVCATCGVRCKKPSVLRKHLRSHTDVRPHHCSICDVGFKTKGNLSKHLNSKAHHSRSLELGSSTEQLESGKSVESSSYDADLDSSCELVHGGSTVDLESDSGCELQPGSSCEVEMEGVSILHQSSTVETAGESHDVDNQPLVSGIETCIQTDISVYSGSSLKTSYSQNLYVDVSGCNQPVLIMTPLQQRQALPKTSLATPVDGKRYSSVRNSAVESKITSPVGGGVIAAAGSSLSALPFVIVSAGALVHLSSSTLPVVNIPQTTNVKQSSDTATVQSCKDSFTSVLQNSAVSANSAVDADLSGFVPRNVTGSSVLSSGMKSVPRLSRLNAVDLSVTSTADSEVVVLPVTAASTAVMQPAPSFATTSHITFSASDNELSESHDCERVIPRREIAPIPGAVCSAEDAARVGSSYLCSFCGKTFSSAPQLAVHRNIHYFERQFKCSGCRSSFASRAALDQHRSKEHHGDPDSVASADPRPYKCNKCGVAFRIQGHLAKHKRSKVHAARLENSQDLPGTVDPEECSNALPLTVRERETELDECQHEASCQETDSVTVNESCDDDVHASQTAANDLPGSDSLEAADTSVCDTSSTDVNSPSCMTAVTSSSSTTVAVGSSLDLHKCPLCSKTLTGLKELMMHLTSHVEQRPHVCQHCDAGFTTEQNLSEHLKLHVQVSSPGCGSGARVDSHNGPSECVLTSKAGDIVTVRAASDSDVMHVRPT